MLWEILIGKFKYFKFSEIKKKNEFSDIEKIDELKRTLLHF